MQLDQPNELPDGTIVLVASDDAVPDDDAPMSLEEIARVLAAMKRIQSFDITPEEGAEIDAGRQRSKSYTIANMHKGIEELFQQ